MSAQGTSEKILAIAREIVASEGIGAVSFDAIARRLGKSKQAVLYWYPTKRALLAAMFLPWLRAEADAAIAALSEVRGRAPAIEAFVRTVAAFHFSDLGRFRSMYLAPQVAGGRDGPGINRAGLDEVHAATSRLYGALAERLGDADNPRAEAVAIHASILGLVMMVALGESLEDPLKHSRSALVDALVDRLVR